MDTLEMHKADRALPVRNLSRDEITPDIERLDLFILGGGGFLFDGDIKAYLREVLIAHEKKVPVMTYALGAGPLKETENQKMVREGLSGAAALTVRDRSAKKVLEEAGVPGDIVITADPALLLKPEPIASHMIKQEGLDAKKRLVGFSVREPGMAAPDIQETNYHALLANAADFMIDRFDADVVFVPMERKTMYDLKHSHAVMAQMLRPERATVLKGIYTPGQLLSLMERFDFAVGMRLHFLIFAALQGVPFVALPYASKVSGFLDDLHLASPPLHLVNAGRVIAHIDHSWDNRVTLAAHIKRMMPELKKRAERTAEIAAAILRVPRREEEAYAAAEKT